MKLIPFSKLIDKLVGPVGSPERTTFEREAKDEINSLILHRRVKKAQDRKRLKRKKK